VTITGCAIECRINAENPADGFRPCPGTITKYFQPGGPGVLVDSHIYSGYMVPPHYDSMVGKLIAWGKNREEARTTLKRALEEYVIEGINTTIPFHRELIAHPQFARGEFDTQFIENTFMTEYQ